MNLFNMNIVTGSLLLFVISTWSSTETERTTDCPVKDLENQLNVLINFEGKIITKWKNELFELVVLKGSNGLQFSPLNASSFSEKDRQAFYGLNYWIKFHGKHDATIGMDMSYEQTRIAMYAHERTDRWSYFVQQTHVNLLQGIEILPGVTIKSYQVVDGKRFLYSKNKGISFLDVYDGRQKIISKTVRIIPKLICPIDDHKILVVFGLFYTVIHAVELESLDGVASKNVFLLHDLINCTPNFCLSDRVDALYYDSQKQLHGYRDLHDITNSTFIDLIPINTSYSKKIKLMFLKKNRKSILYLCKMCKEFSRLDIQGKVIGVVIDHYRKDRLFIFTRSKVFKFIWIESNQTMKLEMKQFLPLELIGLEAIARLESSFVYCINGSLFVSSNSSDSQFSLNSFAQRSAKPHTFHTKGCVNDESKKYYKDIGVDNDKDLEEIKLRRAQEKLIVIFSTTTDTHSTPKKPTTSSEPKIFNNLLLIIVDVILGMIIIVLASFITVFFRRISRVSSRRALLKEMTFSPASAPTLE